MKSKSEFNARLDALIKPYVDYWKLLKNYVKDFEEANSSKFSNSAWDRIKHLEKDIRTSAFAEVQYQTALECESRDKRIQELEAEVEQSRKVIEAGRVFLKDHVEPLRQLAMDISLKYEPCGYYCDPDGWGGGHHDHKLFNHAKYLFGSGLEDYLPIALDPFPNKRADQQTGRF